MKGLSVAALSLLSSLAAAESLPASHYLYGEVGTGLGGSAPVLKERAPGAPNCPNGNTPRSRGCWTPGFSIADDFDEKWPTTGVVRSYDWTITNTTCNPDGNSPGRQCFLINGQYPGPLISADWGDEIEVKVTNNMQSNGTGIHWHGIRQYLTNSQDGTGGITECPIAPGQSYTYKFQATQHGTSWYHTHFSSQYGQGLIGPIVINGPAVANYDIDLGSFMINDWYWESIFQLDYQTNYSLNHHGPGPSPNNILINGKNKNAGTGSGQYSQFTFTPGKAHRLRLMNNGVNNYIRVSIDGHKMSLITTDFTPIKPVVTDSIVIGIGQRYDVIVHANRTAGNFFMRAEAEEACESANNNTGLAIFTYKGTKVATPKSKSTIHRNGCHPPAYLYPYVPSPAGNKTTFAKQSTELTVNIDAPGVDTNNLNIVTWGINMSAINVMWEKPTLSYVMRNEVDYPRTENLISIPNAGVWTYWIVQEVADTIAPVPHPMHLHGHDFAVLGGGKGVFDPSKDVAGLNFDNPTRRDTAMLPGGGWLVMGFQADNPGAWLFHCHISTHIAEGMGVQFLEVADKIPLPPTGAFNKQCRTFQAFQSKNVYPKSDAGV